MDTFDVVVTAASNTDLKPAEFDGQVAMVKPLMNWDPATATWRIRLSGAHPEHVSSVLKALFEAARMYGTVVTVQLVPAERSDKAAASG
ncbi:hypothetical protein [Sphaerisporangium sp. NPDC051011]|uniref:hypothetical protein n=1 Tax=Sphaerisporangium sp. NPDC051011 TaxID=3155792 RepID=UPI0033C95459